MYQECTKIKEKNGGGDSLFLLYCDCQNCRHIIPKIMWKYYKKSKQNKEQTNSQIENSFPYKHIYIYDCCERNKLFKRNKTEKENNEISFFV